MQALVDVILPVFLLLGIGYAAAWRGLMSESAVDGLMRFATNFAVPFLLFRSIAKLDLHASFDPGLLISFYAGAFSGFALGFLGARFIFNRPLTDCVAIGFVCLFSNSLLLGLPITERAYGPEALAGNYAIISIHAPLIYAFGITVMELVRSRGQALSRVKLARRISGSIISNPLVIGILAGFVVNISALPLPEPIWATVDMMVRAALPVALFGLGGVLCRYRPEGDLKTIAMVCVITLIAHPAITWALGRFVFDLDVAQTRSSVMTAAMAPGINAYLFANMYGAARRVAASSVLLATAASVFTVWGWLQLIP